VRRGIWAFMDGLASLVDLRGSLRTTRNRPSTAEDDALAIRKDWDAVFGDLRAAWDQVRREADDRKSA
jgi:hypothetical protein